MKNSEFEAELEKLIADSNLIPSRAFCNKFIQRMPAQNKIPEEYLGRDAEDYYSWGWALWRTWENAEDTMYDLQLWAWMDFYKALDKGDLAEVKKIIMDMD